ncbi:MAG TPA: glycoside hydrolase domain-containing protein [Acidimicrobiales bacterium]|nr:glycoside hydrolase domain-containing protein [Acidimicrobiales bacterium]
MTLQPGDLGIDWSFATLQPQAVKKAGAKFVIRYSAGAASDPRSGSHSSVEGKLITPAEFQALVTAGLDVIANDEWYETRITEGASAGDADAKAAGALWKSCGLAQGASIFVSWDSAPVRSKFLAVARYARAYSKALAQYGYLLDGYAGTPFLRFAIKHALYRYGWRPNAGSWSNDGIPYQPDMTTPDKRAAFVRLACRKTPAHIAQTGNYWFGNQADEDVILRVPVGSHLEALAGDRPKRHPKPKPDPHPRAHHWHWLALHRGRALARLRKLIARLRGRK